LLDIEFSHSSEEVYDAPSHKSVAVKMAAEIVVPKVLSPLHIIFSMLKFTSDTALNCWSGTNVVSMVVKEKKTEFSETIHVLAAIFAIESPLAVDWLEPTLLHNETGVLQSCARDKNDKKIKTKTSAKCLINLTLRKINIDLLTFKIT
jgi:hypothetical protein